MPTENRSSNTEQMVSVPREVAEQIATDTEHDNDLLWIAKEMRKILSQPAAQHQGEPVAWSTDKPEAPGAYWVRGNGLNRVALVEVVEDDGALLCNLHDLTTCDDFDCGFRLENLDPEFKWCGPLFLRPPTSDGFSAEQMAVQGADGYRNGIKTAAELAADYPDLAQAIRALPLPQ